MTIDPATVQQVLVSERLKSLVEQAGGIPSKEEPFSNLETFYDQLLRHVFSDPAEHEQLTRWAGGKALGVGFNHVIACISRLRTERDKLAMERTVLAARCEALELVEATRKREEAEAEARRQAVKPLSPEEGHGLHVGADGTVLGSRSTLRPFGPHYEGHSLEQAHMTTVFSVGKNMKEAIAMLCLARQLVFNDLRSGLTSEEEEIVSEGPWAEVRHHCSWTCSFAIDRPSRVLAGGIEVPGGLICTWWW